MKARCIAVIDGIACQRPARETWNVSMRDDAVILAMPLCELHIESCRDLWLEEMAQGTRAALQEALLTADKCERCGGNHPPAIVCNPMPGGGYWYPINLGGQ